MLILSFVFDMCVGDVSVWHVHVHVCVYVHGEVLRSALCVFLNSFPTLVLEMGSLAELGTS